MTIDVIEEKWEKYREEIRDWWGKQRDDQLIKKNNQHKLFIEILQERYGYTEEKAASEILEHYSKIKLT